MLEGVDFLKPSRQEVAVRYASELTPNAWLSSEALLSLQWTLDQALDVKMWLSALSSRLLRYTTLKDKHAWSCLR